MVALQQTMLLYCPSLRKAWLLMSTRLPPKPVTECSSMLSLTGLADGAIASESILSRDIVASDRIRYKMDTALSNCNVIHGLLRFSMCLQSIDYLRCIGEDNGGLEQGTRLTGYRISKHLFSAMKSSRRCYIITKAKYLAIATPNSFC